MEDYTYRFSLLSPLDHRYYFANKALFDNLAKYFSEEAAIRYNIKVELTLLKNLSQHCGLSQDVVDEACANAKKIQPQEILEEETHTKHNISAVVNVIKKYVPSSISSYIHLGATSYDISDTSASLRLKDASNNVVIPLLISLEQALISHAETHIDVPQVGRTHGQFAVPITLGHFFTEYVSRLGGSIAKIHELTSHLVGKLSGATGAYNALSLIVDDPISFEKAHLESLGLKTSEYSNQICAPEPALRLLLEYNIAFGIIANLADDLRNLQRSEISECSEFFDETHQIGSSTMPQKRNPWNSEHIKSLYKVFSPRILTFYQDQITEHQRDLTNSASQRFIAEYISGFVAASNRAYSVVSNLYVDKKNIAHNLATAGDHVLAEAAYVLLALSGFQDAHEIIRNASIAVYSKHISLSQALQQNTTHWRALEKELHTRNLPPPEVFFSDNTHYIGKAIEKSKMIITHHKSIIASIAQ